MTSALALSLFVVCAYVVVEAVRGLRSRPVDLDDDPWGHEAEWDARFRAHLWAALGCGVFGLALAVALGAAAL